MSDSLDSKVGFDVPWADLPAYREDYRRRNPVPSPDSVIEGLAKRRQWLLWRYEPGESAEKKPRKMPYYAGGGKRFGDQGSERDRARLAAYADVYSAFSNGGFDGVGFAFLPADGLVGIDLDGMIDPDTGEVSERCSAIVQACASYTEYSPSGKGVHVICARDDSTFEGLSKETFKSNKIGVEIFSGRQYFTFTGRPWPGSPSDLTLLSNQVARRLFKTVETARGQGVGAAEDAPPAPPPQHPAGGQQRSLAQTVALAEEALKFVSPEEYPVWIEIGMACKASLGAAGFVVWDAWSARSPKYVAGEMGQRWRGFDPQQISIGSLFAQAESGGWVPPWKKRAKKARAAPPSAAPPAETAPPPYKAGAAAEDDGAPPPPSSDDWQIGLIRKKGEVSSCLANAELALAHTREWQGVIGYDEFAERTAFRAALPFDRSGLERGEWTDDLDTQTTIWLQRAFHVEFSKATVGHAVEARARRARFHPVREALRALPPWDGVRRLGAWMTDYLGVVATGAQAEYVSLVGTYFLRAMVQRVMRPGCKFDYCMVLEGAQGKGKSSVARILAWNWFADTDLDLSNKDSLLALPGHWVYEVAELGSLMRAEERKQKSFLSRQEDEYRPPYGVRSTKVPRQNVFIGTTNEEEYLKDATGARRFWPVLVGESINLDALLSVRELLYAEALADFDAGERCFPTPEEEQRLFVPEQAKRGMPEPFEDILRGWVKVQVAPFSMAEAATSGLGLSADKLTPSVVTRIGFALRKLGCGREENRLAADPGERRLYIPPSQKASWARGTINANGGCGRGHF